MTGIGKLRQTRRRSAAVAALLVAMAPALAWGQDGAATPGDGGAQGAAKEAPAEGTPAVVLDDHRVESLLGREVMGPAGEKIGRVVDVLVSREGELRAAVIDFGGFLGVGTRKVAVAWSTLRFTPDGPVLSMTADELRVTPEYRSGEPVVVVGAPKETGGPAPPTPRASQPAAPAAEK